MERKPTIPEVIDRFRAYYDAYPSWGSLHVVLDDGNFRDDDVAACASYARGRDDKEGEALAGILARMSKTQRRKLAALA